MLSQKQETIECYINLYKSVHGIKPRNMDLLNWTMAEIEEGIRTLDGIIKREQAQDYQDSIHLRG